MSVELKEYVIDAKLLDAIKIDNLDFSDNESEDEPVIVTRSRGRPKGSTNKPKIITENEKKKQVKVTDCSYIIIFNCSCGVKYCYVGNKSPAQQKSFILYQVKRDTGKNNFFAHFKDSGTHNIDNYNVILEMKEKITIAMAHELEREYAEKFDCINEKRKKESETIDELHAKYALQISELQAKLQEQSNQ